MTKKIINIIIMNFKTITINLTRTYIKSNKTNKNKLVKLNKQVTKIITMINIETKKAEVDQGLLIKEINT